ncbi:MAG: hypothetical protein ABIZ49_01385 [Opitutaceae bacterium]
MRCAAGATGNARGIFLALATALSSACSTSHRVTVDSLAKPDADAVSYSIRSADPASNALKPAEAAIADQLTTALSSSEAPLASAQAGQSVEFMAGNAGDAFGTVEVLALNAEAMAAQAQGD